ncbi:MAG: DUF4974 domain-containing protein [Candidatus Pseudobacter hemicellulosilyticus]|uniref:DUF4974 domain-containing protein n=1 Tax=Candidatus Pseudobacter hemicellulosilyticus TaxID=3121375 RepID=A0AAJ6BIV1_9BACT|nr:MAG: DUF4974 domain-containing protein [Pseudobacter sp.]
MKEDRLKYLLERVQGNLISPDEQAELDEWFHTWNPGSTGMQHWLAEEGGEEALSARFYTDFRERLQPVTVKKKNRTAWYAAAASVLIALGILFYPKGKPGHLLAGKQTQEQPASPAAIIRPGGDKAVLTLADGSSIILSDSGNALIATQNNAAIQRLESGSITYQAGQETMAEQAPVYNTLTTPRGGKYRLTLADGSIVTLDAASSITYPVFFSGKERKVEITGQAYVEVVHNEAMPFRVSVKGQLIEDIGTAFNINAYPDDPGVKVTLAEGLIVVHNKSQKVSLVPGQQVIVKDEDDRMLVKEVDVEETVAWKNGWFIFRQENLASVMKLAARWYDVEIIFEGAPLHKRFGGTISRYTEISELLENLKQTGGINYRIEGRKVFLTD